MFDLMPFRRRRKNQPSDMDETFDSLVSDFFSDVADMADRGFKTDIKEDEDNFYVEAELPGMNRDDISVEVEDDNLIISASREETNEEKEEDYLRREIRTGSFQRVFRLDNVNEDNISAEYTDGLLKIQLPKEEPGKEDRKVIDIE